ncbi:MAG: transglutaminase-like domain-containing protein [Candidatus Bathyarchaeota archaeon]|nr:transglutaminase-like domain-containing protein [Candidatus Bathyarchaeota archaeon]MDH5732196.1 transglutaminase-like domain-containing protein [Candidatus Bathyarchaeota archaeon]
MEPEERQYHKTVKLMYLKMSLFVIVLIASFAIGYTIGGQNRGVVYHEHPTIKYHRKVAQSLTNDTLQKELRSRLNSTEYSHLELLDWEHNRLNYTKENIPRHDNPLQILAFGKGRCGEFSILYNALCLACGYRARLIADIYGDHVWTEVFINGTWVHVDPTEKIVNDPLMYQTDWDKEVTVICAFEGSLVLDVTQNYSIP